MANRNEQETEIRRKFLSRRPHSSFDLTERYPDNLNLPTAEVTAIPMSFDVDMVVGDASAGSNRNYAAFQLSLELAKKEDLKCDEQRGTYYIGGICCLMPEVTDDIQEGVRYTGNRVRLIRVPSAAKPNGSAMPENKANAFFGYLVIMLYKNVTKENFRGLSDRHLKELFDAAGYSPRQGVDVSVFSVARHAIKYRCFGQIGRIKKSVLKGIVNHSKVNDSFGKVCSCVAKFLSWIDMTGFSNVYQTLVLSDSPVLRASELAHEVRNLQRAVEAVFDTEWPQYFRIFENLPKGYIVERAKFGKLIAIAEKIMMKTTNVNSRFNAAWVNNYVAMHKNHLSAASSAKTQSDVCLR